jgi:hypothetical protein
LLTTPSGYQNYSDRYDVNGGLDLGYKIIPDLAATLGYRYGHQYQQQYSWSKYSASSDYQRLLFGTEGKPLKWLKLQMQLGPDFRAYEGNSPTHTTALNNLNPVVFYGEANISAEITRLDTLVFQFKQFRWVSSCGLIPYTDSLYQLTYTRKLTDKLTFTGDTRAMESNYTSANTANGKRNDWMFALNGGLRYTFNAHFSMDVSYTANFGVNGYYDLPPAQQPDTKREFVQQIISVGGQLKF